MTPDEKLVDHRNRLIQQAPWVVAQVEQDPAQPALFARGVPSPRRARRIAPVWWSPETPACAHTGGDLRAARLDRIDRDDLATQLTSSAGPSSAAARTRAPRCQARHACGERPLRWACRAPEAVDCHKAIADLHRLLARAGPLGKTAVTVSQPSRTSISTPTPPKRPRVSLASTRYSLGVEVVAVWIEGAHHAANGAINQLVLVDCAHVRHLDMGQSTGKSAQIS